MTNDTLYRQWLMLRMIPRAPKKIDTASIERSLAAQGIQIHRRSIQRDLIELSRIFPLSCHDGTKPYGWCWAPDSPVHDLPGMDPATAFTFKLVSLYLQPMLPRATMNLLEPHFRTAHEVLSMTSGGKLASWVDKVRIIPRGVALTPPQVPAEVVNAVYDALLEDKCLEVEYRKRGERKSSVYTVNPLGLVVADCVVYVVCTLWEYENVMQLVLHRMLGARVLDTPRKVPQGFTLDGYVNGGNLGFVLSPDQLHLKLLFKREAGATVMEAPLSKDQIVTEQADGQSILVEATVADTRQLRGWLFSYGDQVEVLEPLSLRQEFQRVAAAMANAHAGSPSKPVARTPEAADTDA